MAQYRKIVVELKPNATDEEYAELANTLWAVAKLSPAFAGVDRDGKADPDDLNNWWRDKSHITWPK